MTDIVVFAVGLLVSTLVVFGIFSRVPMSMHDPRSTREEIISAKTD